MISEIFLYHFLIFTVLSFFYDSTSIMQKKNLIFVECLPHGKFNYGDFIETNFLALDRYLRRYSENTKKKSRARLLFCK